MGMEDLSAGAEGTQRRQGSLYCLHPDRKLVHHLQNVSSYEINKNWQKWPKSQNTGILEADQLYSWLELFNQNTLSLSV